MRSKLGELELSERVEKAWLYWGRGLLESYPDRAPVTLTATEVKSYARDLVQRKQSSEAAERQIIKACVFLLRSVLGAPDPGLKELLLSARKKRKPAILSPGQVQALLAQMRGSSWMMASLSYGAGLRLMECVRLRVRDLKGNRIVVCDANGRTLRETVMPERAREPMRAHLEQLKMQHIRELADGFGGVQMPVGMRVGESAGRSWTWQYLFPGPYMKDSGAGKGQTLRGHITEPELRQAIEQAARMAGIEQPVSENTLRNSFAAHLLRRGVALCDVEKLLGVGSEERGPRRKPKSKGNKPSATDKAVAGF
ncbi:MAG: tyrosine-type recombinase/integrase [Pseudomonadota bacterium]